MYVFRASKLYAWFGRFAQSVFRFAGKPTGIADASDVAKLLLALPFVLGCLGQLELEAYNSRRTRTRYLLSDPFRPIIGALNEYLHDSARVSHVPSRDPVRNRDRHVDTKSLQALDTLQRVFPYSITLAGGRQRSARRRVVRRDSEGALDDALGGQLPHCGQHPDCDDTGDRDPHEVGRQDQGVQDQQPGLTEPPEEQYGVGGRHGAIQAPGLERVRMLGLHNVCLPYDFHASKL